MKRIVLFSFTAMLFFTALAQAGILSDVMTNAKDWIEGQWTGVVAIILTFLLSRLHFKNSDKLATTFKETGKLISDLGSTVIHLGDALADNKIDAVEVQSAVNDAKIIKSDVNAVVDINKATPAQYQVTK